MNISEIKSMLSRALSTVEGWDDATKVPSIERDTVLEYLRHIYEQLKADGVAPAEVAVEPAATAHVIEPIVAAQQSPVEEQPAAAEEKKTVKDESPAAEKVTSAEQSASAVEEPTHEPMSPAAEWKSLFGDDMSVAPRSVKRSIVMSLYDDNEPQTLHRRSRHATVDTVEKMAEAQVAVPSHADDGHSPIDEPLLASEPVVSAPELASAVAAVETISIADINPIEVPALGDIDGDTVLGDVLGGGVKTLADTIPVAHNSLSDGAPIDSLQSAITLNDRMLLCRDLFDGDEQAYADAIRYFDECGSLDDCMLHIVENYNWSPNSDAAAMMMQLLRRKYK